MKTVMQNTRRRIWLLLCEAALKKLSLLIKKLLTVRREHSFHFFVFHYLGSF